MGTRTFIALDLDKTIIDRLAAVCAALDEPDSKINWVSRDNLHITLNFLGEVPDETLNEVCYIAAGAAAKIEPFEFTVGGLLVMPPHGQPRMVWAGVDDPSESMVALHDELDRGLEGLGLRQEERGFRAHITLARIKFLHNPAALRQSVQGHPATAEKFGTQHVEELVVYASQLTREGPVYTPISRAQLGK